MLQQIQQYFRQHWIALFVVPLIYFLFRAIWEGKQTITNWIFTHYFISSSMLACIALGWYIHKWVKKYLEKRKTEISNIRGELKRVDETLQAIDAKLQAVEAEWNKKFSDLEELFIRYQKDVYEMQKDFKEIKSRITDFHQRYF